MRRILGSHWHNVMITRFAGYTLYVTVPGMAIFGSINKLLFVPGTSLDTDSYLCIIMLKVKNNLTWSWIIARKLIGLQFHASSKSNVREISKQT